MAAGLTLEYFWGDEITPKILNKYINAYNKKLRDELNMLDLANHTLGVYIKTGIAEVLSGKSNSYPKDPLIVKKLEYLSNKNAIKRVYSKEETEKWLEKQKRMKGES